MPVSKEGDIWLLGDHKLICGDSTKAKTMKALMGDELADMVFTDPPYNVDYGQTMKDSVRGTTPGNYPAVNQLVSLAATVKGIMGGSTDITYAADWSEYHSTGGWFNLDPLWASANIDFVGIDSYFPITEDLPQIQITEELIQEYWEKGEGWDYYYTDSVARTGQTSYGGDPTYAWKNLEHWWNSTHTNPDMSGTSWTAKMKPVWFTEFGFPSVDGCANQPNVFYDPTSSESFYPRGSKGRIDFQAQREALNATLDYLEARNQESGKSDLVPRRFVWTWDARPFSFWPDLEGVWQDSILWATGHWVQGKLGNSTLGAIVAEILQMAGLSGSDYDVSRLTDTVEGFIIDRPITVRNALEYLTTGYFFDVVESDGILKCVPRGNESVKAVLEDDLLPSNKKGVQDILEINYAQELELPQRVNVTYLDRPFNYDPVTQTSQRQTVRAVDQVTMNLPIVMGATLAKKIADVTLYGTWKERTSFQLKLPPRYVRIEPTDVITVTVNGVGHEMRVVKTDMEANGVMKVNAVAEDISSYDFTVCLFGIFSADCPFSNCVNMPCRWIGCAIIVSLIYLMRTRSPYFRRTGSASSYFFPLIVQI
ncbi:MAG: hypothetical protein CMM94_02000 [Rickettsiales bacterium]|nr:hypothetical protein [Rickettsiales bacterium]